MKHATQPDYLKEILQLRASGSFDQAGVTVVSVLHDNWCQIWNGGSCNCKPTVRTQTQGQTPVQPNRASRRKGR